MALKSGVALDPRINDHAPVVPIGALWMRRLLFPIIAVFVLAACDSGPAAQFWRPISEPNMLMPVQREQAKLDFDISQCHCGIYPTTTTRDEIVTFQPDKQRLAQTGITVTADDDQGNQCSAKPSLIVTECMRERGWEPTNCSGRMPLPGGGSLCTSYIPDATPSQ